MGRLGSKIAMVTGGASGLGNAIARRFVTEGVRVLIADIDAGAGEVLYASFVATRPLASSVHCGIERPFDYCSACGQWGEDIDAAAALPPADGFSTAQRSVMNDDFVFVFADTSTIHGYMIELYAPPPLRAAGRAVIC